jgi:2-dehydro-3-deoxyphosphogluconate aldolase/(4S)-4-hydroxy-2-oxoglutarate aldolase
MSVFDTIARHGVVPVIEIEDAAQALPLADALIAGGLPVAEVTFRTPAAREAIAAIAAARPEVVIGSGTVLTNAEVDASVEAGARFGLSPGLDLETVAYAAEKGLPFAPSVLTPSELQAAIKAGCPMVKFFPAMASGGPAMLSSIIGPYAHCEIGFNPTGGVTLENMADWFAIPQVRAVGGTWIARRADIAAGRWDVIAENARAAVARMAEIRAG